MNERVGVGWKVKLSETSQGPSPGSVLIPRGSAPDEDHQEEPSATLSVPFQRVQRSYTPSLTLTGSSSRKRKTLASSKDLLCSPVGTGGAALLSTAASPTTQIARKIDSIRLDAGTPSVPTGQSASGLPVVQVSQEGRMEEGTSEFDHDQVDDDDEERYGPMSLVMVSEEESHAQGGWRTERLRLTQQLPAPFTPANAGPSLKMESSSLVPEVATNVEVVSNNDLVLERELSRAEGATLMKRTASEGESGEEEEGETGRKIPKVTQQRVPSSRMSAIRVPTIIGQPMVPSPPFTLSVYPPLSSTTSPSTSPRRRPRSRHSSPGGGGGTPSSPSPTREHVTGIGGNRVAATLPGLSPPTVSPVHPRISSFSISELSKSDKVIPVTHQHRQTPLARAAAPTTAFFHPGTAMLLLPQLASVYPWSLATVAGAASTAGVFQGDTAEKDDVAHASQVHVQRMDTTTTLPLTTKQPVDHQTSPLGDQPPSSPAPSSRLSPRPAPRHSPHPSPAKNRSPLPPSNSSTTSNISSSSSSSSSSGSEREDMDKESSEGYHSLEQTEGGAHSGGRGRGRRRVGESQTERNIGIGGDGRQNALLQVSEAHLAILPDEDGDTPLHLAVIHENFPLTLYLVRLIVGVYFNLDIANNLRQTPLHLAVITKQPMVVQLLVQAGASVNFPDRRGNTCIHLASQRRDLRTLQILSQASNPLPDFNIKNFSGLTPIHVATREGSIEVIKFLFQMRANKNCPDACSGRSPLHYAVESENLALCNFLLENGCNVNATTFSGNTPLHIAAGRKLKEIVALLMAYGANPAIANGEGDFPSDLPASLLVGAPLISL